MQTTKQIMQIKNFSGINQAVPHSMIEDNQAIFMGNMRIDNGILKKRCGFKEAYNLPYENDFKNVIIFKNDIYNVTDGWHIDGLDNTLSYVTILHPSGSTYIPFEPNVPATEKDNYMFMEFNDELYIFINTKIYIYDRTASKFKLITPYVPTTITTCNPQGSGQYLEDMNLLHNECYVEYSIPNEIPNDLLLPPSLSIKDINGNTVYPTYGDLTANGVKLIWETDYIDNGYDPSRPMKIIFTEVGKAKLTKGTNNVILKAIFNSATIRTSVFKKRFDKIAKCKIHTNYGGDNDTRILLSGNPDMKNCIFRSGVLDPTYFPENAFQLVGDNSEAITSFQKQYDCCLVFKESSIWRMEFNITPQGIVDYPIVPLNDHIGCEFINGTESIENNAIFLNKTLGLGRVFQSNQRGEANVGSISRSINKLSMNGFNFEMILDLPELEKYKGLLSSMSNTKEEIRMCDDGERIYISCYKNIYVYDYVLKAWYIWEFKQSEIQNMFIKDTKLYICLEHGVVYELQKEDTINSNDITLSSKVYSDNVRPSQNNTWFGETIRSIWISKQYDFGINEKRKTVDRIFIEMQSLPRNSIEVYTINKDNNVILISEKVNDIYGYNRVDYSRYGYNITSFPREMTIRYKAKKIGHFQLIFMNNENFCASNVNSFDIRYKYNNYFK